MQAEIKWTEQALKSEKNNVLVERSGSCAVLAMIVGKHNIKIL